MSVGRVSPSCALLLLALLGGCQAQFNLCFKDESPLPAPGNMFNFTGKLRKMYSKYDLSLRLHMFKPLTLNH